MTNPADPAERALELARLISHHDELYYGSGQIEVTDAEYDALMRELRQIEADHPDVDVVLSYGGSSGLATQITQGAPADVFAAAAESTMTTVVDAGDASESTVFTTNTLVLVVPEGNPAGVTGLADLANPDLAVALCDPAVPCGATAQSLFAAAGVAPAPVASRLTVTGTFIARSLLHTLRGYLLRGFPEL